MERINILEFDTEEIDEIEETPQEELQQRFRIQDLGGCDWAFRKLSVINIKENEIEDLAKQEIERINKWQKEELEKIEDNKAFFEGLLVEYFTEQKMLDPKFKLSTPNGKVTSRKQQPVYEYDTDKFIKWAEENKRDDLIRIKREIDKTAAKKTFIVNGNKLVDEDTGEFIEGVTVTERADSISVKVE